MKITISSREVIDDLRSAAWLEQELHTELNLHRRHEMADICEKGSMARVWRVLGISIAEIRIELRRILRPSSGNVGFNDLDSPEEWNFDFLIQLSPDIRGFLKEKIHDYLVSAVMADRVSVIIPGCAGIWRERTVEARSALREVCATAGRAHGAARCPLWPW